jgi:hypothetical protein
LQLLAAAGGKETWDFVEKCSQILYNFVLCYENIKSRQFSYTVHFEDEIFLFLL